MEDAVQVTELQLLPTPAMIASHDEHVDSSEDSSADDAGPGLTPDAAAVGVTAPADKSSADVPLSPQKNCIAPAPTGRACLKT